MFGNKVILDEHSHELVWHLQFDIRVRLREKRTILKLKSIVLKILEFKISETRTINDRFVDGIMQEGCILRLARFEIAFLAITHSRLMPQSIVDCNAMTKVCHYYLITKKKQGFA